MKMVRKEELKTYMGKESLGRGGGLGVGWGREWGLDWLPGFWRGHLEAGGWKEGRVRGPQSNRKRSTEFEWGWDFSVCELCRWRCQEIITYKLRGSKEVLITDLKKKESFSTELWLKTMWVQVMQRRRPWENWAGVSSHGGRKEIRRQDCFEWWKTKNSLKKNTLQFRGSKDENVQCPLNSSTFTCAAPGLGGGTGWTAMGVLSRAGVRLRAPGQEAGKEKGGPGRCGLGSRKRLL